MLDIGYLYFIISNLEIGLYFVNIVGVHSYFGMTKVNLQSQFVRTIQLYTELVYEAVQ